MAAGYSTGELARRTGCHLETIRYYERAGIMPKPPRTAGGHRVYADEHAARLTFVLRGRELGFPLDTVRGLLALVDSGSFTCEEVHDITVKHLAEVRHKLRDLRKLEKTLGALAAQCQRGTKPDCAIIQTLYAPRS